MIKKFLITMLILLSSSVCLATPNSAAVSTTTASGPIIYCPHVRQLQKNPNPAVANWTAETQTGLWKSYDPSFATRVVKLTGAQWSGEEVGQVTCVYQSEQKFLLQGKPIVQPTLPILLMYHTLTLQPSGQHWKSMKKNNQKIHGVLNCKANIRENCPFRPRLSAPKGNILEQAEDIKLPGNP